jgi:hypothetical protein
MTTRRSVLAFLGSLWPATAMSTAQSALAVPPPSNSLHAYNVTNTSGHNAWAIGDAVYLTTTYVTSASETTKGPNSNTVTAAAEDPVLNPGFAAPIGMTVYSSSDTTVTGIRIYINVNGTWRGYVQVANATQTHNRSVIGTPGTPQSPGTPCFVCGSTDLRDLARNVTGESTANAEIFRTRVRTDLPPEQYCGNCGTKRVNRWAV